MTGNNILRMFYMENKIQFRGKNLYRVMGHRAQEAGNFGSLNLFFGPR